MWEAGANSFSDPEAVRKAGEDAQVLRTLKSFDYTVKPLWTEFWIIQNPVYTEPKIKSYISPAPF